MEKELEDNQPNYELGNIILARFYKEGTIGLWLLYRAVTMPQKEFADTYLSDEKEQANNGVKLNRDDESCFER